MLKLSTSSVQAAAPKTVGCSEESLAESIYALSDASESLFSACADADEVSQVLANLDMCAKGIKEGGLSKQVLGAFNSEGELSACCGQENLTVAGLEALAAEEITALSGKYSAALEGKMGEYWAKFVQVLKKLWEKVKHWFITLWQNRARLFKSLDDVKNMKEFNGDAEAAVYSNKTYLELAELRQGAVEALNKFKQDYTSGADRVGTFDAAIETKNGRFDEILKEEPKSEKLSAKGWDLQKLQAGAANFFNATAPNGQIASITKWINGALDLLVKKAGEAGKDEDGAKKELVKKQHAALSSALALVRFENKVVLKMFNILYSVKKAGAKAAKKEEKKEEKK